MADLNGDEEQIEALKNWWSENGTSLMLTLCVAMAAWGGWNWWQASQQNKLDQSYIDFQGLVVQLEAMGDQADDVQIASALFEADRIKENYPETYYASFSAFIKARQAVVDEDFATAISELEWILAQNPEQEIVVIAKMRLAQAHLANDSTDAALASLDMADAGTFQPAIDELRGDILLYGEQYAEAVSAYESAKGGPDQAAGRLLEAKIDHARSFL